MHAWSSSSSTFTCVTSSSRRKKDSNTLHWQQYRYISFCESYSLMYMYNVIREGTKVSSSSFSWCKTRWQQGFCRHFLLIHPRSVAVTWLFVVVIPSFLHQNLRETCILQRKRLKRVDYVTLSSVQRETILLWLSLCRILSSSIILAIITVQVVNWKGDSGMLIPRQSG